MEKTSPPRQSAKRAAILDAAQACFLENGYANTSMDMVAGRAGVSKATIYAHFQGKDDLFGAIIKRRCDDHATGLGSVVLDEGMDARAALTAIGRHLMRMLLEPEVVEIYRVVVAESPRHPDLARVYYEAGPLRGKTRIADILQGLSDHGLLSMADSWLACDQFIGMLRGECFHRVLLGLPESERVGLDKTIDAAVEVMLAAYGPAR